MRPRDKETVLFDQARPIFLQGLHRTPDVQAGFYLPFDAAETVTETVTLRCAAATFYRAYLNGELLAHGPARAAHGHARVDEIDLTARLRGGRNDLAIEVAGYNRECIYTTGDASYLQAEVVAGGKVLAATADETAAVRLTQRRPAERLSHARVSGEVYRLDAAYFAWRTGDLTPHPIEVVGGPRVHQPRGVPLPTYRPHDTPRRTGVHSHVPDPSAEVRPLVPLESDGAYMAFVATLDGRPAFECAGERPVPLRGNAATPPDAVVALSDLTAAGGVDLDFGEMKAGFLRVDVETPAAATLDLVFADHLEADGDLGPRGGGMNAVVRLGLPGGRLALTSFEPQCLRYLRVIARDTPAVTLHSAGVVDYAHPDDRPGGTFACSDDGLNRIYEAARLTLRLNTQDVFMDCPGRERAGWLCDSLFSARAMRVLFGDGSVERAMLENFLHAPQTDAAPGHFPQCYPAEKIVGGNFIPNWSMFLALELPEYVRRSGDAALGEAFRGRIERLVGRLHGSQNTHGLLENLPGFTFVDWSAANGDDYKQPISTATNALYALMLDAAAALYDRPDWSARAAAVRATLRGALPLGGAMADALRRDGDTLVPGATASEAAQYYLFWTGTADAAGDRAAQWDELMRAYGPAPDRAPLGPPLAPCNVFIGLYLRLETLAQRGEHGRLLREMRDLFLPMLADGPGTLWEHKDRSAGSVCHGFASHAAVWLVRDILGIADVDALRRTVTMMPNPAGLAWARGTMLVDGQSVGVDWRREDGRFVLSATVPQGYAATLRLPESLRRTGSARIGGKAVEPFPAEGVAFDETVRVQITPR